MDSEVGGPQAAIDIADPADFAAAIAQAYHDCSLGAVDMRSAVSAIESVREAPSRNAEPFPTWRELDDQIGRAVHHGLSSALLMLRQRYEEALLASQARWLASADFPAWVTRLGQALGEWRLSLCEVLAAQPPQNGPPASEADAVATLKGCFAAMKLGDWDQALPALTWLGSQEAVAATDRARILARAAQVDLYFSADRDSARRRVDVARTLADSDRAAAEIDCVAAQCLIEEDQGGPAAELLESAIAKDPRFVESYVYRGDVSFNANDLPTAESWYRRALSAHPGSTAGYMRLIRLLARPELFKTRRGDIAGLLERALAVVPSEAVANLAEASDALREAGDLDGALHFADRAVALGPNHGRPFYARGLVHAARESWEEALADFRHAAAREPSRYEKTRWYMLGVPQALELLLDELRQAPQDAIVRDALLCYVEQSNAIDSRFDAALDVLAQVERSVPPADLAAQAALANARGDLYFFRKDYALAGLAFRAACSLEPTLRLYANNLVTTLRWLAEWDQALQVVEEAARGDEAWRQAQLAAIFNEKANAEFAQGRYAEASVNYARAAKLAPGEATYRDNLGLGLDQTIAGSVDADVLAGAARALGSALEQWPDDRGLRGRLEAVRQMQAGMTRYGLTRLPARDFLARIRVAANLRPWVSPGGEGLGEEITRTIGEMRGWFQKDFGIVVPAINFLEDASFPDGQYELELFGVPIRRGQIRTERRLLTGASSLEQARERGIVGETAANPLNGEPAVWLDERASAQAVELGFPLWAVMEYPLYDLAYQILRRLKDFVGHTETRELLEKHTPPSAARFDDDPAAMTRLVQVLRGLLAERVPITAFGDIAGAVAAWPAEPVAALVRACRLLPSVCTTLPGAGREAPRAAFPELHESAIAACIHAEGAEPVLAISSRHAKQVLDTIGDLIAERPGLSALVVRDATVRAHCRRVVELNFPQLWLLSQAELDAAAASDFPAQWATAADAAATT